jgi:uncharacterized protein YqeY
MTIVEKIRRDIIEAMKNKTEEGRLILSTLRLLISELEKEKVALKLADITKLTDDQTTAVINRQVKKLDKEIEAYVEVGYSTEKQETEKKVLITYLPTQLTEAEVEAIVTEVVNNVKKYNGKIGQVMKELSAQLKGRADMKVVSKIAKEEFNA